MIRLWFKVVWSSFEFVKKVASVQFASYAKEIDWLGHLSSLFF